MSDLIKRLRKEAGKIAANYRVQSDDKFHIKDRTRFLTWEAADELDRLTAELKASEERAFEAGFKSGVHWCDTYRDDVDLDEAIVCEYIGWFESENRSCKERPGLAPPDNKGALNSATQDDPQCTQPEICKYGICCDVCLEYAAEDDPEYHRVTMTPEEEQSLDAALRDSVTVINKPTEDGQ